MAKVNEDELHEAMSESGGDKKPRAVAAPPKSVPAPNSELTGAVAIATQTKAHVERVTEYILTSVKDLRAELDDLERDALGDCARVKSELDAMVVGAEAMVRSVNDVRSMITEIRSRRAHLVSGASR